MRLARRANATRATLCPVSLVAWGVAESAAVDGALRGCWGGVVVAVRTSTRLTMIPWLAWQVDLADGHWAGVHSNCPPDWPSSLRRDLISCSPPISIRRE